MVSASQIVRAQHDIGLGVFNVVPPGKSHLAPQLKALEPMTRETRFAAQIRLLLPATRGNCDTRRSP
jgi:hypothetical protein